MVVVLFLNGMVEESRGRGIAEYGEFGYCFDEEHHYVSLRICW